MSEIYLINSEVAFDNAITYGSLHGLPASPQWAGNYMYMHSQDCDGVAFDFFKHCDTRKYIKVERSQDMSLVTVQRPEYAEYVRKFPPQWMKPIMGNMMSTAQHVCPANGKLLAQAVYWGNGMVKYQIRKESD